MDALLTDILDRLRSAPAGAVEVSGDVLAHWPAGSVAALRAAGVLTPGQPATGTVCPGCEHACAMSVEQVPRAGRDPLLFIVCDKRDDVASVPVPAIALERWRITEAGLADALARLLGANSTALIGGESTKYRLGVVVGRHRKDMAYFARQAGVLVLLVAGHALDLLAVLHLEGGRLALDTKVLQRAVDAPAAGAGLAAEATAERTARLHARKAELLQRGEKAFVKVLAMEEGISESMIKRILARSPKPAATVVPAWAAAVAPSKGVSAGSNRKR